MKGLKVDLRWWISDRLGDLAAIDVDGSEFTYAELVESADGTLRLPRDGRRRLILLAADNGAESLAIYMGALLDNHAVLLCAPNDTYAIERLIRTFRPDVVALPGKSGYSIDIRQEERAVPLHPELAVLLSTSGSTGSAKLVRLSKANIWENARSIAEYLELCQSDRGILSLPMHYAYGLSIINSHIVAGAAILLNRRSMIEPEFWRFARSHGATSFAGVPHNYELLDRIDLLANAPPTLRYFTQAGGRLPPACVLRYATLAADQGWRFFVMYGQSEATARMAYLPPERVLDHPDAIGIAIPKGKLSLRDADGALIREADVVGELVYEGPNVMMGYATCEADLALPASGRDLLTGDLAARNEAGLYRITGRISRFIKLFGKRFNLDDIESILSDAGYDVIATGIDDKLLVATRSPDASRIAELLIDRFGLPSGSFEVRAVEVYPRLSSGKIDYATLKSGLEQETTRRTSPGTSDIGSQSVASIFQEIFGPRAENQSESFTSLGGDSLTYVTTALELEQIFGTLPDRWEQHSIAELSSLASDASIPHGSAPSRFSAAANFDTLRGLACLLVVAYHVVGMSPETGLRLAAASPWHRAMDALDFIRMPLFTVMAGYLYALMSKREEGYFAFIAGKARTLLIPAVFAGVVMWALRSIAYGSRDSLIEGLLNGYLHLWYLYALIVMFALVALVDYRIRPGAAGWLLLTGTVTLAFAITPPIRFFSISAALGLMPFFMFGLLLCRHSQWRHAPLVLIAAIVTVLAYIATCSVPAVRHLPATLGFLWSGIASLAATLCLMRLVPPTRWLAMVGAYSFTIYLWHPLANAAVRNLVWLFAAPPTVVMFCLGCFAGVAFPIALHILAERKPMHSLPLIGR